MNLKNLVPVVVFTIVLLFNVYASFIDQQQTILIARILSFVFLTGYYCLSVEKIQVLSLLIITLFFGVEFSFYLDGSSVYGFTFILVYRILLLFILLKDFNLKANMVFFRISTLSIVVAFLIMFAVFTNSMQYYLGILVAIVTALLLSVSFAKVLNTPKKGNLDMFLAVLVMVFTEAIFSFNHKGWYLRLAIFSLSYHYSYFVFTRALVKKQQALEKTF